MKKNKDSVRKLALILVSILFVIVGCADNTDRIVEVDSFDPFDGISVSFVGFNGCGSILIENNGYIDNTVFQSNVDDNLYNGEIVEISLISTFEGEDKDVEELCMDYCGKTPSTLVKKYTVSGLQVLVNISSFSLSDGFSLYPAFLIKNNVIHVVVPNDATLSELTPVVPDNIVIKKINGVNQEKGIGRQDFSDFLKPVKIELEDETGKVGTYVVIVYNLPVLSISTPENQEITSKKESVEGCEIVLFTESSRETIGSASIKLRGNSTAILEKKPYNIKLDKKSSILGMNKSKKWVLLANAYYDRTQLHNATAFEVARLTDYLWVQDGAFVELILNGEHKGLYYLCEKIEIEKTRINIDELKPDDSDDDIVTGGYLLESDVYAEGSSSVENNSFAASYYNRTGLNGSVTCTLGWYVKDPDEEITTKQFDYIKSHMAKLEKAINIYETTGLREYQDYIDIETLVNWYLIEEICMNEEASRLKNMYLYKKRGDDKIYVGPPWDFDAWTFGLYGPDRNYLEGSGWIWDVLLSDPIFVNRLKEKWEEYKDNWAQAILSFIDEQYDKIHKAAERNEIMWNEWHSVNSFPSKSYYQIVSEMKDAFSRQLSWMDSEINSLN